MDNAVATVPNQALAATAAAGAAPERPGFIERWRALPPRTQFMALAGVAALVAVLVLLLGSARNADYRVLFPNLSEKDGGQVIERLTQMNVPYRFSDSGAFIMVPASRVHELRMKLSAAGVPTGGVGGAGSHNAGPGYELLDKTPFGQTQGQERMNVQRAIEGELTRTIQSLASVQSARVHLAIPNQNGFFREQQKPSASVVLNLHPGRALERSQIAGIVHLVSSSVPELSPKAVSVLDSSGALLSGAQDADSAEGLDSTQLQYRREIEAGHLRRILALLEPVVGRDNVRASVTAEIDFSQVMQTAEAWRPNQGADARIAIREQRTQESTQPGSATPAGVPGATSNQPPVNATAPITGASAPLQGAGGAGAGMSSSREGATRYELDKTTTVTRAAVGQVKRLSAAVVVNHRANVDAKGKTTSAPLSDKEIEQLTALVQQGIGFNGERGDQVKVINAPFRAEPAAKPEGTPLWQEPWLIDLLKSAAAPVALGLVGLAIVFALLKPAVTALLAPPPPPPGAQVNEVVGGDNPPDGTAQTDADPLAPPPAQLRLEAARKLAKENPAAVANIVRGWVNGETA
jgi:flagellar M-ring protein FliF